MPLIWHEIQSPSLKKLRADAVEASATTVLPFDLCTDRMVGDARARMQRFVARMIAMLMRERTIPATTEYGFCHLSAKS